MTDKIKEFLISALMVSVAAVFMSSASAQEPDMEAWAAGRETNYFALPEAWRLTQPVTLRISFRLKAEPGSAEADAFLQDMRQTIEGLSSYYTSFETEPVVVPAHYHYANTLTFENLARWRAYETTQELRDFVFGRWINEVEDAEEMVTIAPKE